MQNILKRYYNIPVEIDHPGYFQYKNEQYYIDHVNDILHFHQIYQYYHYLLQQCQLSGYMIIQNNQDQWLSNSYVLLKYCPEIFSYNTYLEIFLTPLPLSKINVCQIKEQWIVKINDTFHKAEIYDKSSQPIIYYYLAMAENSINILNYLLQIDNHASLPLCLSLIHPISHDIIDLLNPCNYMISTRIRHLIMLVKSHMLTIKQLRNILDNHFYDIYEIIYIYAHSLYPGYFFDCIQKEKDITGFYQNIISEKKLIQDIYQLLSLYVSLPKIHWINDKNML